MFACLLGSSYAYSSGTSLYEIKLAFPSCKPCIAQELARRLTSHFATADSKSVAVRGTNAPGSSAAQQTFSITFEESLPLQVRLM